MKTSQSGFTLIELMIVIAIVGILAAIAVPQYQNYVARSQTSEGISLASGVKTAVEVWFAENGGYPATADLPQAGIQATSTDYATTIVAAIAVGDGTGEITATFNAGFGNGIGINFEPTVNTAGIIVWECQTNAVAPTDLQYARTPASCRNPL